MPRPKKPGAPEPKRRSRNGCWPCKSRKVKCDEGHPRCDNCIKASLECDYSIRLSWLGDGNYIPSKKRRPDEAEETPSVRSTSLSRTSTSPPRDQKRDSPLHGAPDITQSRPVLTSTVVPHAPVIISAAADAPSLLITPSSPRHVVPFASLPSPGSLDALSEEPLPEVSASFPFDHHQHNPPSLNRADGSRRYSSPTADHSHGDVPGTVESPPRYEVPASPPLVSASKRPKYGIVEPTAEVTPWSPSSTGTSLAGSPWTRPWANPTIFLPSAPPSLTSGSTPPEEEQRYLCRRRTSRLTQRPDIARLSVQSLLTSSSDRRRSSERLSSRGYIRDSQHGLLSRSIPVEDATFYGYDTGEPDLDIGRNDDDNAVLRFSPADANGTRDARPPDDMTRESHPDDFGFVMRDTPNYYEKPVAVWISKELEPLPPRLRQSPMNILYFHHFLNHTARVLVPHDDPQSNPFRTVLPLMAVRHDNLLSLLLAYSASHRARHLGYAAPSLRIALLVQGVIAGLRSLVQQSMSAPAAATTEISTADLAAAIMLASLEIISPAAIGLSIPWHHHLGVARELISRMPDGLRPPHPAPGEHCVRSLLWSWFAYLDVLGSLSGEPAALLTPSCYTTGGPLSPPLPPSASGAMSSSTTPPTTTAATTTTMTLAAGACGGPTDDDEVDRIDCILGFTPRCVFLLARIAELARHSEAAAAAAAHKHTDNPPSPPPLQHRWLPDAATRAAALDLETACLRSLAAPSRPCGHVHAPCPLRSWDRTQMAAANRAFHHAALIHLHRRVLGKTSAHPDVRAAAQSVLECLEHVDRGSSAEMCLLFPMFTAGCELADPEERAVILGRILTVERTGMMQVQKARKLMQRVWETGQPWETLVDAEFIG